MVKKVSEREFDEIASCDVAVIDFSATWCGPCKMLAPVLEEISEEMTDVAFFNIDVDENPSIAQKYKIMSIPAVVVLKKGEYVNMSVGFQPKPGIEGFIKAQI